MDDSHILMLRKLATAFRAAIETTRAERLPGALPYFPEGACRMTSRLLALYLSGRFDDDDFDRPQLVSGVLPNSEHAARHFWLEIDGAVIDDQRPGPCASSDALVAKNHFFNGFRIRHHRDYDVAA